MGKNNNNNNDKRLKNAPSYSILHCDRVLWLQDADFDANLHYIRLQRFTLPLESSFNR